MQIIVLPYALKIFISFFFWNSSPEGTLLHQDVAVSFIPKRRGFLATILDFWAYGQNVCVRLARDIPFRKEQLTRKRCEIEKQYY